MKSYLLCFAFGFSLSAYAQTEQLQFVQHLYQTYLMGLEKEQQSLAENQSTEIEELTVVEKMFSPSFQAVIALDKLLAQRDETVVCLEHDYIVQGRDYDLPKLKETLKISPNPQTPEVIEVRFYEDSKVDYVLECQNKKCRVSEIFEYYEGKKIPFKESLAQCLLDYQAS